MDHHFEPELTSAERRWVRECMKYFHSKGTTMAKTLDDLVKESADLKTKLDSFVANVNTQLADLKAQIAALQPDPAAQEKIDATIKNIEDSIADITPPANP